MDKAKKQVCTIRILFPVDTDEQAIGIKKKIAEALADIPEANIDFGIRSMSAFAKREG